MNPFHAPHHPSIRDCADAARSPFSLLASAYARAYRDAAAAPPAHRPDRSSRRKRLLVGAFAVTMAAIAVTVFAIALGPSL